MTPDTYHLIGQNNPDFAANPISTAQSTHLQGQLDDLKRELHQLKRERRFHGGAAMAVLCLLSVCIAHSQSIAPTAPTTSPSIAGNQQSTVSAPQPSTGTIKKSSTIDAAPDAVATPVPEIVCRALKVVDEKGRVLAVLGGQQRGGFLSLRGRDTVQYVALGIGENGGLSELNSRDGQVRVFNGVDSRGGLTRWFGNDGKLRARMAIAGRGGDLTLTGGRHAQFSAGVAVNDSGLVEILGSDGKPRARIGVLNGNGAIVVLDSKGRIQATLP
ncbi:MAG: hypothetical protein JWN98_491 [Abditibacteriota bacterium]|nr:hypothetical protein [Abditibacteriota bacterium]